jgi:glycosyltransferase involved in cell wall biosynthesis
VIRNGDNGFVDTRFGPLAAAMQAMLDSPQEAARMGANARRDAHQRFGIERFVRDWTEVFARVAA